jgi:hypothetical protein
LRLELQDAGFRIEKMGYFFFVSFFIVAPIRIIRKFLSAESRSKSDTTTLPPRLLNEFLKILLSLEMKITDYFSLPLGTTLYAVVSKNGNQ